MDYLKSVFVWLVGIIFIIGYFPVAFFIWLIVLPFDRNRSVIHRLLLWQSMLLMKIMPFWRLEIKGQDKIKKGTYVVISNHQSIIDILVLNCLGMRYKWISKIENTKVPFLGWYLKMADYITVDRDDAESKDEMLARSLETLKSGQSLMIFPEGTRSRDNQVGYFKRGAFQLALEAGVPILPVVVDGTGEILPKHGLVFRGFHKIRMKVLDPVYPDSFVTSDVDMLAKYFREKLTFTLQLSRSENK